MNDFKNMWDFEVMEGVNFPNCNRVHPLMQKRVQRLSQILTRDDNIGRIVLFGSALEFRCSSYSDLDVYVEKIDVNKPLQEEPVLDCEVDIVFNLNEDNRLYKEIYRKGMLLFDRGDLNV